VAVLSLPDWFERNSISRKEPSKESTVGRTPGAAAAVLQVQQSLKDQTSADTDRMIYVIGGEGTVTISGHDQAIRPGWLAVIPRGTPYSIVQQGRNPLVMLSITAPPGP
jgi:mannose-6-phosphate isomerase-like protein (cupin superfamily)